MRLLPPLNAWDSVLMSFSNSGKRTNRDGILTGNCNKFPDRSHSLFNIHIISRALPPLSRYIIATGGAGSSGRPALPSGRYISSNAMVPITSTPMP